MTLSDLAAVGGIVSSLAVLVSLVYLAIQIRQAEKNQRAALNQGYINRVTDYLRWYAESPLNELRARVVKGDTAFTAEELQRMHMALRVTLLSAQDAYLQYKAGLADDMTFDNSMRNVRNGWLNQPVYRVLCRQQLPSIAPEFAGVLEKILYETPVAQPHDLVAIFQADLAAEKAAGARTGTQ
jgi:hypothetical protein